MNNNEIKELTDELLVIRIADKAYPYNSKLNQKLANGLFCVAIKSKHDARNVIARVSFDWNDLMPLAIQCGVELNYDLSSYMGSVEGVITFTNKNPKRALAECLLWALINYK